jgi:hypothetical protein
VDSPKGAPGPLAEARILNEGGEVRSGDLLQIQVSVRNLGKGNLHALRATATAKEALSLSRALIFGRIESDKLIERLLCVQIPTDTAAREFPIDITFSEANSFAPEPLKVLVRVKARP